VKRVCFGSLFRIGLVVQLVRISACHAEGREFESRPDRQHITETLVNVDLRGFFCAFVEHLSCKVGGKVPLE
jgi:hypothetical protein